jgi:hypothetical protein
VTLQRQVAAAAAGARTEAEFFAALGTRGLLVRLRHSTHNPGEVTGYAVGLNGDYTAAGDQIWYGGGKLAPDLSLPKLRRRWPEPGEQAHRRHDAADGSRPRLYGHGMTTRSSRTVLRREVNMCAAAARSEQEFFAGLDTAGLLVRLRHSPTQPTQVTGFAVSLPGMTHCDGQQVWYGGQTLDGQLSLGALRRRWQAGRPGTPPAPDAFAGSDTRDIFGYATAVAADAARQLRASPTAAQSAVRRHRLGHRRCPHRRRAGHRQFRTAAGRRRFQPGGPRAVGAHPAVVAGRGRAAHRRLPAGRLHPGQVPPYRRPPGADQRARRAGPRGRQGARVGATSAAGRRGPWSRRRPGRRRSQQRPGGLAPARYGRFSPAGGPGPTSGPGQ